MARGVGEGVADCFRWNRRSPPSALPMSPGARTRTLEDEGDHLMIDSAILPTLYRTLGLIAAIAALTSTTGTASAEGRPPLPPEAYAACDSKREGDACSVQIRDREIQGTCTSGDTTEKLFCRPSEPPPPRGSAGSRVEP